MERLMIGTAFVALFAGLLAMSPTNIFKICAWNAGTMAVDPWRIRSGGFQRVSASLRAWFASLGGLRIALCCLALILALLAAQLAAGHGHVLMAAVPLATLKANRATLFTEAAALKRADGTFENDEKRAQFDAKMTEVEALDAQIREAEAIDRREAAQGAQLTAEQRQAVITEERARVKGITDAVRVAGLERTVADEMIGRGITLDAARAEIFAKLAEKTNTNPTQTQVAVAEDARVKSLRGAMNWLLVRAGVVAEVAKADKVEASSFDPGEYRGLTLVEIARTFLERAGRNVRGWDRMRIVGEALTLRDGMQSISDFATLLENTMNKVLQAQYAITPDTWRRFCNTSMNVDFRAANRYRWGNLSSLDTLTEKGEFKYKGLSDAEKATITVATKGNIINMSRQMIVNDDMNAFSRVPQMLGRAAALSIEVDVYALLGQNTGLGPTMADTHPLFDAAHSNISTGAALSAASIDADRVVLASQKDVNGVDFLDLRPNVLVIPVGLGGQARVINQSQYDPDNISGASSKATMRPNIVVGLFRDVVDTPRLSGTRRYLFADPSIYPVLEVAFLEGQQAPVLETRDGWNTDGAELKARFDYGVAAVDTRGAVTNAGA